MTKNAKGIDVSRHQGKIDWNQVKKDGIDFAVIRAGFGNTASQKDERFEENIQGALEAGLSVGVYWFSYASEAREALKEAEACHKVIKKWKDKLALPVFFDFEYDSETYNGDVTYTRQGRTDIIRAFCEAMKGYGYAAGYYTNRDYILNRLDTKRLPYDLWLADYSGGPDYPCALQQTGSTGKVKGISGNVDTNLCFKEYGKNKVETAPSKEAAADIFYRVRTQKHGWLPEVKNLEDYAGYEESPITDVAVRVSKGGVKYRTHVLGGGWLPYVTGCDIGERANGYAGIGKPIDAIELQYEGGKRIKYRVSPVKGSYYPWQYGNETKNGQDGYAGLFGKPIGKLQVALE